MRWTPRLRTVFLVVSLVILLLPLGGIVLLRLYESVLVRRTEEQLIAQGAVVAAVFRAELRARLDPEEDGGPYGVPVAAEFRAEASPDDPFRPISPRLDLAVDPVLPDVAPARAAAGPADPAALAAGERLTPVLEEVQKVTLAGIRVVDFHGTVVATTRGGLGRSLAFRREVGRALRGEHVSLMRERNREGPGPPLDSISRGTGVRVYVSMPVVEEDRVWGAVVLSRTPQGVAQSLWGIRGYLAGGAAILLLAVLLVAGLTSATIVRPIRELIRRTERVAAGDAAAAEPLERPGTFEVRQISEAFARMARAQEERAGYINAFASSVSHEFKTPLTSMRGSVELLRDHLDEMTGEERDRFIGNLEADTERLERLVNRLLELTRAEMARPGGERTEVAGVLEGIAARFRAGGLEVRLSHGPGIGAVRMGREPLETVLANLVDNARRHGGPEVGLEISTRAVGEGGERVEISVRDGGPGISEANLPRVFDRFFTTARERGGSGLGLAIVKALVEAHGGSVSLSSRPGETVVRVVIPA